MAAKNISLDDDDVDELIQFNFGRPTHTYTHTHIIQINESWVDFFLLYSFTFEMFEFLLFCRIIYHIMTPAL
mgnify:FL=1